MRERRSSRMTVYVRIAPSRLAEARVILNVFWTLLINVNTRETPQDDPGLKHQVLLALDEFPALGHVAVLAKGVGYLAGYNLRFLTIAQSISQLNEIYGTNGARAFATNHALQIVFAPRLLAPPPLRPLDVAEGVAPPNARTRLATDKDLRDGPAALLSRLAHNLEGLPPVHDHMTPEERQNFVSEFLDRFATQDAPPKKRGKSKPRRAAS